MRDGARNDDEAGRADVLGAMPDRHDRSFGFELLDEFGTMHVGAAHARAARQQQACDRTHADPADADEMVRHRSAIHGRDRSLRPIPRPVRA